MRRVTLACTLLLPLLVAACGNDDTDTPTAPTDPVATVTDTFTGTLVRNGGTSHPFPIASAAGGDVTATLKAISPNGESLVGMSLGTWNGSACQVVIANDRATVSSAIIGLATTTGQLCLRIYDIGTITDPQDYEVEVVHP
jgi:hypothetical protein